MSASSSISVKEKKDARLMLARQVLILPIHIIRSFVILPFLSPAQVFILKTINTWLGYVIRVNLGSFHLLGFYYPAAEAVGDEELGNTYMSLAWYYAIIGAVIGAVVGGVISIYHFEHAYFWILIIWGATIVPTGFAQSAFLAKGRFNYLAGLDIVKTVGGFVFSLIGLFFFGFKGYLAGIVISLIIVIYYIRKTFFLKTTRISKSFFKRSIFDGAWVNLDGFLAVFARTYEVSIFALSSLVTGGFAGQYAVAMTIASAQDSLVTAVSHVYQRKIIKELSVSEKEDRPNYELIKDFVILDINLFIVSAMLCLFGTYVLVQFLPKYEQTFFIVPFLMLGVATQRLRFYPGVIYKLEKIFFVNIISHIIHLIFASSILLFLLKTQKNIDLNFVSMNQAIGAGIGSLFIWIYFYANKVTFRIQFNVRLMILLSAIAIWFFCIAKFIYIEYFNLLAISAGLIVLLFSKFLFKTAFDKFTETLIGNFLNRFIKPKA